MDQRKIKELLLAGCKKDVSEAQKLDSLYQSMEPKISDFEIVQKALDKTGYYLLCTGQSYVVADHTSDEFCVEGFHFNEISELLTWAKQTIGHES
jgi:hypothetical protein